MDETQKALIRFIFQSVITTQSQAVYDFLYAAFLAETEDDIDAQEYMEAWQRLEGWINSHGLEGRTA